MDALPGPSIPEQKSNVEGRMTFTEHLSELRTRLVRSGAVVIVGFVVSYGFSNWILEQMTKPLRVENALVMWLMNLTGMGPDHSAGAIPKAVVKWVTLTPLETIFVKLKFGAYGGLLLASPYVLYHICGFIFPGLTSREKRVVQTLIAGCSVLAVFGASMAYYIVFPFVLPYMMAFTPDFAEAQLRLSDTLDLIFKGILAFAIGFQCPMAVLVLVWLDLLSPVTLKKYRRVAVVVILVIAMILTPPDPFTMIIMAIPLYLLYEISIVLSTIVVRRRKTPTAVSPT